MVQMIKQKPIFVGYEEKAFIEIINIKRKIYIRDDNVWGNDFKKNSSANGN